MSEADLAAKLSPSLLGVRLRLGADDGPLDDVVMLATVKLDPALLGRLPNLRLIQKLGAGVDSMLTAPGLAKHIRVARLAATSAADEIAEYCLAYVLAGQRNMAAHAMDAAQGRWHPIAPKTRAETTIAVLGLGHIGGRTAALFADLGFHVMGWSRSPKALEGVACHHGVDGLHEHLTRFKLCRIEWCIRFVVNLAVTVFDI